MCDWSKWPAAHRGRHLMFDGWKELPVHVDTYVDDHFEDHGIVVTVPEEVELSEAQRRTIVRVAESLDNEVCFALIDDQTCVMLRTDEGRYGFNDYFVACVNDQIEGFDCDCIGIRLGYIGGGESLPVVYDDLIRLIFPAYCPELSAAMREGDIPVDAQLLQREKVREACAEYSVPLAMVMPREPVFHDEYNEDIAEWTEEDDYDFYDEGHVDVDARSDYAAETLRMILRGELAASTDHDEEKIEDDLEDLKQEMHNDLWELEVECDDEIGSLAPDADGDKSESDEVRIAAIKERYEHAKSIRQRALDALIGLKVGQTIKNDELVEEILRYYSAYVTLETGARAVRSLLERDGFDPERDIEETVAMLDALRKDPASAREGSKPQRELVRLERMHSLLSELLEKEEAERRAAEEEAERQRMQLRAGNTLLVTGGPLEGRNVLVKEVEPDGRFAIVELEMFGRKNSVKIAEGDLRHS